MDVNSGYCTLIGINTRNTKFYLVRDERSSKNVRVIKSVPEQKLPIELEGAFSDAQAAKVAFTAYMARTNKRKNAQQTSDELPDDDDSDEKL